MAMPRSLSDRLVASVSRAGIAMIDLRGVVRGMR